MQSIFSSAARQGKAQEKIIERAGELKIHWAKPPGRMSVMGFVWRAGVPSW
jgi:hypothetical protein